MAHEERRERDRPFTLRDIVSKDMVTIAESASVADAAELLAARLISGLVVVDARGEVSGAVSAADLVRAPSRGESVRRVMSPHVFAIDIDAPVSVAARVMFDGKLHRLFVREEGRVIGIVTQTDVVRLVSEVGLGNAALGEGARVPLADVIDVARPRDVVLASLARCGEALPAAFYRRFLASSDEVRQRFARTDMKTQQRRITEALALATGVIENAPHALGALARQAELHDRRHLNVRPELYGLWLEALIGAVGECDPAYDVAVEHSFRLIMGHVVERMIRAY